MIGAVGDMMTARETEVLDLIGAGGGIASAEQILGWAMNAVPGDICIYGRATMLPPGHAGARQVRALASEGLVSMLAQVRQPDGRFAYRALRLRGVAPAHGAAGHTLTPAAGRSPGSPSPTEGRGGSDDEAASEMRLVMVVLRGAARAGRPCPSNAEIARRCGLKDADRARYRIRQLRDAALIRVETVAAEPRRVVTIVNSGKRTGVSG